MRANEFITKHTEYDVTTEQDGYSYAEHVDNVEITDAEKPDDGKLLVQVIKRVGSKDGTANR